jgi:hypothetical protein
VKLWPLGVAALLGLGAGFLLFRCKPDPMAQFRADSLATARQHLLAGDVWRAHSDSVAQDSIAKLTAHARSAATKVTQLQKRADSLTAVLRTVGISPDVQAILAVKDSALSQEMGIVENLKVSVTLLSTRLAAADSAVFSWRTLQEGTALQLQDALKRGSGPRCIIGPGATIGWRGYAVGLSVTCRL